MLRIRILSCLFLLFPYLLNAQNSPSWTCGSDILRFPNGMLSHHDALQLKWDYDYAKYIKGGKHVHKTTQTYTIPVVVHIIHNNGTENISNTQVLQAIQDLNNAFSNTGNYQFPLGIDTKINFCLAQRSPDGQGTNGINRVTSPYTNLTMETQDIPMKNLSRWEPKDYMNIWVVKSVTSTAMGPSVAGYAFLPAAHGLLSDGVVVEAGYFGNGTHFSKVVVHEVGHYLGLYHPFEGGCSNNDCLLEGDKVCDTPPDASNTWVQCNELTNSCQTDEDDLSSNNPFRPVANGGLGDQLDLFQDYMDYSQLICTNRFTEGQLKRMQFSLDFPRKSLLESMACSSPCNPIVSCSFTSSLASPILINQSITFSNNSLNATSYNWFVNGINLSSSANFTHNFNQLGTYIVRLEAEGSSTGCMKSYQDTIEVKCSTTASFIHTNLQISLNGSVTFTSTSSNATTYSWMVNGVLASNNSQFVYTPSISLSFVNLIVSNNECSDTSTIRYVQQGECSWKYNNFWAFGDSVSLVFSTSPPTVFHDTHFYTNEPSTSFCDKPGNVLFYSDGLEVRNALKNKMPNGAGLLGHTSARAGALSFPYPGQEDKYILFTRDAGENGYANGLRYNIIDMALDGGLGDVALKNQLLGNGYGEGMCGVYSSFLQKGYLVYVHLDPPEELRVFEINSSGVNISPVFTMPVDDSIKCNGFLQFSHDGKKIAFYNYVSTTTSYVYLFDFDMTTGALSNPIQVLLPNGLGYYSCEFSPNNKILYFCLGADLYQLDLSSNDGVLISNSLQAIANAQVQMGQIQKGIDNKIYAAALFQDFLICVNNPNVMGVACNISHLDMDGAENTICLPNFVRMTEAGSFLSFVGNTTMCEASVNHFQVGGTSLGDSVSILSSSNLKILNYTYNSVDIKALSQGNAYVVVQYFAPCGLISDTFDFTIIPELPVFLGNDTTLCNVNMTLSAAPQILDATYSWSTGSLNNSINISDTGTYWIEVHNTQGCNNRDSIQIFSPIPSPNLNLGNDKVICKGEVVPLAAGTGFQSYNWLNIWDEATFTAFEPGLYWVEVTGDCGFIARDSILLSLDELAVTVNDTTICPNSTVNVSATGNGTFEWATGETGTSISLANPGDYWVKMTTALGCVAYDSFVVTQNPMIYFSLGENRNLCAGNSLLLLVPIPNATYLWSDGSTQNTLLVESEGWYSVEVTQSCTTIDSIYIRTIDCCGFYVPNVFTPNQDDLNETFDIKSNCVPSQYELKIYSRWGKLLFMSNNIDYKWDGKYEGKDVPEGVYIYNLNCEIDNTDTKDKCKSGEITLIR